MIKIYHNPRCSKSRETLALVEALAKKNQEQIEIIDYQKKPLSLFELSTLLQELGGNVQLMLRDNEDEYQTNKLEDVSTDEALHAIIAYPKLLQRPIVSFQGKSAIGRPPEQVLALFKESI